MKGLFDRILWTILAAALLIERAKKRKRNSPTPENRHGK